LRGLQESSGESHVSLRPRKVKGLFREVVEDKRGVYYNMMGINMGTGDTDAYSDWIHSCVGEVVLG